jgi:hypothetical protein
MSIVTNVYCFFFGGGGLFTLFIVFLKKVHQILNCNNEKNEETIEAIFTVVLNETGGTR